MTVRKQASQARRRTQETPRTESALTVRSPEQSGVNYPHSKHTVCIHATLLIPGRGSPTVNQLVVAAEQKIVYVGSIEDRPLEYRDVSIVHVPVLLPGLWDCHTHFTGSPPQDLISMDSMNSTNPAEAGARAVRSVYDTLMAGFTSCVDLGGYAIELQKVIAEGSILGPTLYGAGAGISMTGGHGDSFTSPLGQVWQRQSVNSPGAHTGTVPFLLADGIEECRKAVRINLRRGAKVIKVMASGGAASRDDDPMFQQFSDEELATIVSEANRMGLVCAAHAVGKAGIMAVIRAGFKVIEHGSYSDDEVFQLMKEKDMIYVAATTAVWCIYNNKDAYPREVWDKVAKYLKTHLAAYSNAIKAGVKCALGSDLYGGPGSALGPGQNGHELYYAVQAGMTPLEAIEAATANGPLTLGPYHAPKSGQIKVGYDADIIALGKTPLEDISIFTDPSNITHIWKGGRLVKGKHLVQ
ncbi:hypothetical protein EDD36DRAFT_465772 [Exophiala viscosa]|uniref:Amidohydrolase-related domain-containing protein n=1 Tax=Exophiala viscosa TaxID=2486360 RepID=A0AAN6DTN3_9EURO|nr:hypothetical protein EDD36DRAFT_465772 [Exophiala viscosa]